MGKNNGHWPLNNQKYRNEYNRKPRHLRPQEAQNAGCVLVVILITALFAWAFTC